MTYKATLGITAKFTTISVTVIFAIIIWGQYFLIKDTAGRAIPVYTTSALLLIYFISFAMRPLCYRITPTKLIVCRFLKNVTINRNQIKAVKLLSNSEAYPAIRIFGISGFWGHVGKFANSKLGGMTWYSTRKDKMVLVELTSAQKIVLTPDDPEKFVSDCNN